MFISSKRAIFSSVALIIFSFVFIFSALDLAAAPGDVNGNGVINDYDTHLIVNHIIGAELLTSDSLARSDANQDNKHDVADLVWDKNNADQITINLPDDVPLTLIKIPAGSYQMGSPDTERGRSSSESPVHIVNIAYDFYMGKTEITQKQWLALMKSWPEYSPTTDSGEGNLYPAYQISWDDAKNFIAALNKHIAETGQGPLTVRLPSEAEWEYACRAGTQTRFFFGDSLTVGDYCEDDGTRSMYMWYCGNNSPNGSKPVGTKPPNQFGLYDVSGNVWEWCEDDYHNNYNNAPSDGSAWVDNPRSEYRLLRGGDWNYLAWLCRSASRGGDNPTNRDGTLGFRVCAQLP